MDRDVKTPCFFKRLYNEYAESFDIDCYFLDTVRRGSRGHLITGYTHIGQHFESDLDFALRLLDAPPAEYSELLTELTELIGYNLEIIADPVNYILHNTI